MYTNELYLYNTRILLYDKKVLAEKCIMLEIMSLRCFK